MGNLKEIKGKRWEGMGREEKGMEGKLKERDGKEIKGKRWEG